MIHDGIIQNGTPQSKILILMHLTRHSNSAFNFHEKWRTWKVGLSVFKIWKQNWKILFLSRVMALWKQYTHFQFCHKKYWRQQNFRNLATIWYIFSKALMVHYHCTKFTVCSISLCRYMDHGQKWPPDSTS